MRKKLDTRFPASRIKKIMQADEDVGKIALAVPVLVSKALELFLQDLCDRTYSVTLERGSKTINSLHLKQCVHDFPHYDFLRDIVSKVPDLGTNDIAPPGEDTKPTRRRKAENEENEEDLKRLRGRGRPRGTGRKPRGTIRSTEDPGTSPALSDEPGPPGPVRDFDLNLDLNEMPPPSEPDEPDRDTKSEEDYPGWSVDEMKKLAADPAQFVLAHQKVDDEEEDYDEEDD